MSTAARAEAVLEIAAYRVARRASSKGAVSTHAGATPFAELQGMPAEFPDGLARASCCTRARRTAIRVQ